jgi:hypothetical protein
MRNCRMLPVLGCLLTSAVLTLPATSYAQGKKKPPVNPTRGTTQVKGGDGVLGETYSLQSGFNFRITSAEFSIERFVAYENVYPKPDEKLLLMHVALKNANKEDNFFNTESHSFTIVDANDKDYQGHNWRRESTREKE